MKRIIYGLLLSLTCMHAAHADRMTGTATFDVPYWDYYGAGFVAEGSGFFELRSDHVIDFEFSVLGFTWTEDDIVGDCDCVVEEDVGVGDEPYPDLISLVFASNDGNVWIEWGSGGSGYFESYVDAGQYHLASNYSTFSEFDILIVPEPPALALFALAFLAAAKRRHTWPRLPRLKACQGAGLVDPRGGTERKVAGWRGRMAEKVTL